MGYQGREIKITIRNFEKYKGRADVEHNSWFRCSNRLLEDYDFYDFSAEELLVWVYFLSIASQLNRNHFSINFNHASMLCRISRGSIISAIRKLNKIGMLDSTALRGRYAEVTGKSATDRQTNKHNTLTPSVPDGPQREVFDFEALYKIYPRKDGKSEGLKKCVKQITNLGDYELLKKAIENYARKIQSEKTEPKFIKYFSTFMSTWRDCLDPDYGTTNKPVKVALL